MAISILNGNLGLGPALVARMRVHRLCLDTPHVLHVICLSHVLRHIRPAICSD